MGGQSGAGEPGNPLLTSETAEGQREYPADSWYSVILEDKRPR